MSDTVRRACAAALLLLALMTLVPPFLPPDGDGLPGFDDTDGDNSPPASAGAHVAALPPVTSSTRPLRVVARVVEAAADGLPEPIPPRALPSRSPPRS